MERLRQRRAFLAAAKGRRKAMPAFVVQWRYRGDESPIRIGFTVTRKTAKNAVDRNRIRRRLKEAVRQSKALEDAQGYDVVLVGRRKALSTRFAKLVADLSDCTEIMTADVAHDRATVLAGAEH